MSTALGQHIAILDRHIALLAYQKTYLEQLRASLFAPCWPKRTTLSVCGDYVVGVALGLTGDSLRKFCTGIQMLFDVHEDGTATLVACDGQPVQPVPPPGVSPKETRP